MKLYDKNNQYLLSCCAVPLTSNLSLSGYTGMQLLRPKVVARAVSTEKKTLIGIPHYSFDVFMTICSFTYIRNVFYEYPQSSECRIGAVGRWFV